MSLSDKTRQAVQDRAGNCCEYCRLSATSGIVPFHVDHIIPLKHDGSDDIANLCLACFNCNTYKSHDLTGFDPATQEITPLFNPRQQVWNNHFEIQEDMRITGLTPEGRTTVRVLQMNLEERVESRQVLAEISQYPCEQA
ncbi:MAG: HNH endonuclease [Anaerolineaceae bacterium]|nr:HNH endonuclease [Anaerolineaceae bacterium]